MTGEHSTTRGLRTLLAGLSSEQHAHPPGSRFRATAGRAPLLMPAAEERKLWTEALEAEEDERLQSLEASMQALLAQERPTSEQVGRVLVSALQAQTTLIRSTRIFPLLADCNRIDKSQALKHRQTAKLACELHRCWGALGVTVTTREFILRKALLTVGTMTWKARADLSVRLDRKKRTGIDAGAHAAFVAEGTGQYHIWGSMCYSPCTQYVVALAQVAPSEGGQDALFRG